MFPHVDSVVHVPNSTVTAPKLGAFSLWHNRLEHSNSTVVNNVLQACNIQIYNKNTLDFITFLLISTSVFTSPLELVYSDIRGLTSLKSLGGYYYYASFIDACMYSFPYPVA